MTRSALVRLMLGETSPTEMTPEQLVGALAELQLRRRELLRDMAVELNSRDGWTWDRIGAELGVAGSTVHRWARGRIEGRPPAE